MAEIPYGLIGLFLILIGWIYETGVAIKNKKTNLPITFAILYGVGSALLAIHSLILNDMVFLTLNGTAAGIAIINAALSFKKS